MEEQLTLWDVRCIFKDKIQTFVPFRSVDSMDTGAFLGIIVIFSPTAEGN
jgi:hypothetical protein